MPRWRIPRGGTGGWGNRAAKIVIIIVVLGAVAATGWLAGNGAANPELPADTIPSAELAPEVITVEEADIVSRMTVDASIEADPPDPVRTERTGIVTAVYRKKGQRVNKGEAVMAVRSEPTTPAPEPSASPDKPPKTPKPVTRVITAPVSGRVADMSAHVGQEVSPSSPVATIDRGLFKAVATINPKEVYRLYERPKSIKLAIDHGPAPFSCKLLAYGAESSAGSSGGGGGDGGSAGGPGGPGGPGGMEGGSGESSGPDVQVSCRIPSRHRVFAGVRGKMSITTDSVANATVVPLSAVLGENDKGQVTVVTKDGKQVLRKVKLGINDGKQVEIIDGLKPGEQILDRAPQDPAFSGPGPAGGEEGGPPGGPFIVESP